MLAIVRVAQPLGTCLWQPVLLWEPAMPAKA
jgi:hypothetical protein